MELNKKRILVIDDSSYMHSLLALGLSDTTVVWARRILDGVDVAVRAALFREPFDLYIVDRELADGWGLEKNLRQFEGCRTSPVVYFSWNIWSCDASRPGPVYSKRQSVLEILELIRAALNTARPVGKTPTRAAV